ncbi:MAG: alpha/beta hydrolase [Chloroflexi bacterium]|nr:alpha/beta hydrolase [Chloroflexota bacterium]
MLPRLLTVSVLFTFVLASCTAIPHQVPPPLVTPTHEAAFTPIPVPTDTPLSVEINEIIQVGEYRMPIHCLGQGEPTIILVDGDNFVPWDGNSLKRFSRLGRVCSYKRAGLLNEPTEIRTVRDQVHDLHNLLTIAGERGPYVLVGVSRAGLHLLLFTQEYPDEVVGLVFIECQPPTYYSLLRERLGQEKADDPDWVKEFRSEITVGWDYTKHEEKTDILASTNQAMEVTSLGDRPVVVLVAGDELTWTDEWEKVFSDAWLESQTALNQLSENSRIEIVPDFSHKDIVFSSAVDRAVEEVYLAVKHR